MVDQRMREAFKDFCEKTGKRKRERILNYLGKEEIFIAALSTTLGQELLADLLDIAEKNLRKLLEEEDQKAREKFNVCYELSKLWASRVNKFVEVNGDVYKSRR